VQDIINNETLRLFLIWVIGGGGAAQGAYWLMQHVGWLQGLASEYKRYASLIIAALLGCAAYVLAVLVGYEAAPAGWVAWLEALVAVAGLAAGMQQALHGRRKLRK
jgi:hypothetical protein